MAQLKGRFALADSPMTIGQLADALGSGKPAASILVERLVQLALVERAEDPLDRRRTIARVTPQGEELVARLRQGGRDRLRAWLSRLGDDDLAEPGRSEEHTSEPQSHRDLVCRRRPAQ